MFEVSKPKQRLLEEDVYQTKPQIASKMIRELQTMGFKFKLVLADSLYGESDSNFLSVLYELQLDFVVAIRSNHGVWLPQGQKVRDNRWRPFPGTNPPSSEVMSKDSNFGGMHHLEKSNIPPSTNVLGDWRIQLKKDSDPTFRVLKAEDIGNAYLVVSFSIQ